VHPGPHVLVVLLQGLRDALAFSARPGDMGVDGIADGVFVSLDRIRATGQLGKEFCPGLPRRLGAFTFAVPTDCFPMAFAFGVRIPEAVHAVELAGARIPARGEAIEHALELRLDVFARLLDHSRLVPVSPHEGNFLIQNLSNTEKAASSFEANRLYSLGGRASI